MPEDSPSKSRGAHTVASPEVSFEELVREDVERRAEFAKDPANIAYEQMKVYRRENTRKAKLAARGTPEVEGPPNPYKPNRR